MMSRHAARECNSQATILGQSSEDDSAPAGVCFNGLCIHRSRRIPFPGDAPEGRWLPVRWVLRFGGSTL